jgi:hypothetical protein
MNYHISRENYPILFNIKKDKRQEMIEKIFNLGYNYYFKDEQTSISTNDELVLKISTLEDSMNRLIGISNSSMRKGEFAENILENYIVNKYTDITYDNMAQVDHCGDAWLSFDSFDDKVMLESKNYTNKVNKDEIEKMKSDMITNHIRWGIFISWNSTICNYRDFDIMTFHDNGNIYTIIMLSNVITNMEMIDVGIMVIKKLITNFSKLDNFPWIKNKINSQLDELNKIITMNYLMRDNYYVMEKTIKNSLDKFYTTLREYMNINTIVSDIKNTMDESTETNNFDYVKYLNNYSKNKKIFILLSKIVDVFREKNITIHDNILIQNDTHIGSIKIMGKKITILCSKYNATCEFIAEGENDNSFSFLNIL